MEHGSGFSLDSIGKLNSAITKFSSSDKNQSGGVVTPFPAPTGGHLKLNASGTANNIGSIDVTVDLPVGVKVQADSITGEVAAGVVAISGVAAVGDSKLVSAKYTPGAPGRLHIALVNTTGFGAGEFATIKFDLVAGGSFPASKDAFSVSGFTVKGQDSVALVGVTAAPAALGAEL